MEIAFIHGRLVRALKQHCMYLIAKSTVPIYMSGMTFIPLAPHPYEDGMEIAFIHERLVEP